MVKQEDVLLTQKNDLFLILADYVYDQFTLRIQDKYKKPMKKKVETLLQENTLLNETDLYGTDDPVIKRIPQGNSKSLYELHTLLSEIEYQNFNEGPFVSRYSV